MTGINIRRSRSSDLATLSELEKSGEVHFRSVGMNQVAESPAPDTAIYENAHHAGRIFVAVTLEDAPIGFVRIEIVDNAPHVEQVSVHPHHAGHGIGASLLSAAEDWARQHGFEHMTLTTFRDVPWNGPYYSRLGWAVLNEDRWGPQLAAIRQQERALGFDEWPRQAMFKGLAEG